MLSSSPERSNNYQHLLTAILLGLVLLGGLWGALLWLPPAAQAAGLPSVSGPTLMGQATGHNKPLLQTVTTTVVVLKDNTLYESATGALSNGIGQFFFVGRTNQASGQSIRRGLLAFNLAAANIPADSTIISVSLKLNMSKTAGGGQTISLHRVLADWGEAGSLASGQGGIGDTPEVGDATWIHRFFNATNWATPGGNFAAASASTVVAGNGSYTWRSAQMVSDVQGWYNSPSTNFGWLLRGNEAAPLTAKRFDSRENDTPANRPVLTITYEPPPPPTGMLITKSVNDTTPTAGQLITYTILITNITGAVATNSTVIDVLPTGINFVGPVTATPLFNNPDLAQTAGDLPVLATKMRIPDGETITMTFPVTVSLGVASGTRITNTATITTKQVATPTIGSVVLTVVNPSPQLKVGKQVNNPTPNPGDLIVYTIVVTNSGTLNATNVLVSDTMPAGISFVGPVTLEPPGQGTLGSPPTLASGLTITAGRKITLTFPALVNANVAGGSRITNTAAATSAQTPAPSSGSVALVVSSTITAPTTTDVFLPAILKNFVLAPDLVGSFRLTPDKSSYTAGEPVQITVVITNQGTATAGSFWADFFINPNPPPVAANTIWSNVCGLSPCYGMAWFVSTNLAPGQSVTLTSTPASYSADHTIWPGSFAAGSSDLYLFVDSWNPGVASGGVAESNETNNRAERHGLSVSGLNPAELTSPSAADLPPRPAPPDR